MKSWLATAVACVALAGMTGNVHGAQTERQTRDELAARGFRLYTKGDLAGMDNAIDSSVANNVRTPSGLWASWSLARGIEAGLGDKWPTNNAGWDALENRTMAWTRARPQSTIARVMHARVMVARARFYGGEGADPSIPDGPWQTTHQFLLRAQTYLLREKAVASRIPEYYETLIDIAVSLDKPYSDVDALLAQSDMHFAPFYQSYFAAMMDRLPSGHGTKNALERFANEAVARTRGKEGRAMYARIYWYAAQVGYGPWLFKGSAVRWPEMKAGFDDIVARYPDQWNLQNYARFACEAQDLPTYKAVMKRVTGKPLEGAWHVPTIYADCKRWAAHAKA